MASESAIPQVDDTKPEQASLELSKHRTKLSTHRTDLSEHRTELSTGRTEMSSRRTGMSFQRTRMSADRTLMSVIRTSLSMISFGFTIYQFFGGLHKSHVIAGDGRAAGMFGQALVYLGVGMIAAGMLYHVQFMSGLRSTRREMIEKGYIHGDSRFPTSLTFLVALLLLLFGVAAIVGATFKVGPFG